jgi:8-oxo-dGTP diphosphatase
MTSKPMGVAVRGLIFNAKGEVLLLRRTLHGKSFSGLWDLPGGKPNPGERLDETCTREIFEETGLSLHPGPLAGVCESEMPHIRTVQLSFFAKSTDTDVKLSEEHEKFCWVAPRILCERSLSPQIEPFLQKLPTAPYPSPATSHSLPIQVSTKGVIRNESGEVFVLQRSFASKGNGGKWEFPGGKSDAGESIAQTLEREVNEETGLHITPGIVLGCTESVLNDRRIIYIFLEAFVSGAEIRLSDEHNDCAWVSRNELANLDLCPQFRPFAHALSESEGAPSVIALNFDSAVKS